MPRGNVSKAPKRRIRKLVQYNHIVVNNNTATTVNLDNITDAEDGDTLV